MKPLSSKVHEILPSPASTGCALETQTISLRDRHAGFSASFEQPLSSLHWTLPCLFFQQAFPSKRDRLACALLSNQVGRATKNQARKLRVSNTHSHTTYTRPNGTVNENYKALVTHHCRDWPLDSGLSAMLSLSGVDVKINNLSHHCSYFSILKAEFFPTNIFFFESFK